MRSRYKEDGEVLAHNANQRLIRLLRECSEALQIITTELFEHDNDYDDYDDLIERVDEATMEVAT